MHAHVNAEVHNCTRTRTLIVTSSSPSSPPSSSPSSSQDNETGTSGHPPVPLWPAAGQNQNMPSPRRTLTGAELQKLVEDMFPEVAGVWNFLDDDDLMVEWARYHGC